MSQTAHDGAATKRNDQAHWDQAVRSLAEIGDSDNVRLMRDLLRWRFICSSRSRMNLNPKQRPSKARAFKAAGWVILVGSVVLVIQLDLSMYVAVVPVYIAYLFLRRGKKYSVETGEATLKNDDRAPVLYLRSFKDEEDESSVFHRFKHVTSDKTWLASTVPNNGVQEQDALGYVFRKVGPYVALGKPGEDLPELGSAKLYVSNDAWQDEIRAFFGKSRLIIFRAGGTEGLKWELAELVRTVNPQKVVLILPVKETDYISFVQWANGIMPREFPQHCPSRRIVVFDETWRPSYLPKARTLTESFAPFFEQNGISVKESYWEKILEHNGVRW